MTPILRAMGLAVALAVTVAITQASVLRMSTDASAAAVLRLAWTARPDRIENCRPQSESEQANIPAHMRQTMICEGVTAEYRLDVRYNGQTIADHVVRAGGLRHDRPLYVFHEFRLPAGDAVIGVRFVRVGTAAGSHDRVSGAPLWRTGHAEVVPASLLLERQFQFVAGEVVLVTYDPERRALVAVEHPH
jgi:hypothetical protein